MKLAVLGSPIRHSKSPALHQAAYAALHLDWSYQAVDIVTSTLAPFLASCGPDWRGLSLTMPLKRDVIGMLDEQDDHAQLTGAANTILFHEHAGIRRISGFNTDVHGVQRALVASSIESIDRVRLLGAGATAASIIVAVKQMGVNFIELSTRSPHTAEPLAALMTRLGITYTIADFSAEPAPGLPDLVISAIPGGAVFEPHFSRELRADVPLLDIAYDPWPSTLANSWNEVGGTVISGIDMLLHQALLQVRIFVNGTADRELDGEEAVFRAMRQSIGISIGA